MFNFNCKSFNNPKMSKYIKEQTNKSIEKYLRKPTRELITIEGLPCKNSYNGVRVSDLVSYKQDPPVFWIFLPFIVWASFLAGYNFHKLTN